MPYNENPIGLRAMKTYQRSGPVSLPGGPGGTDPVLNEESV